VPDPSAQGLPWSVWPNMTTSVPPIMAKGGVRRPGHHHCLTSCGRCRSKLKERSSERHGHSGSRRPAVVDLRSFAQYGDAETTQLTADGGNAVRSESQARTRSSGSWRWQMLTTACQPVFLLYQVVSALSRAPLLACSTPNSPLRRSYGLAQCHGFNSYPSVCQGPTKQLSHLGR
jgi:hypothetical protein